MFLTVPCTTAWEEECTALCYCWVLGEGGGRRGKRRGREAEKEEEEEREGEKQEEEEREGEEEEEEEEGEEGDEGERGGERYQVNLMVHLYSTAPPHPPSTPPTPTPLLHVPHSSSLQHPPLFLPLLVVTPVCASCFPEEDGSSPDSFFSSVFRSLPGDAQTLMSTVHRPNTCEPLCVCRGGGREEEEREEGGGTCMSICVHLCRHTLSEIAMVYSDTLWYTMVCDILWYTVIYCGIL